MLRRLKEQMCRSVSLGQAGKTRAQCHLCFERKKYYMKTWQGKMK
jgi:hypothetical protein